MSEIDSWEKLLKLPYYFTEDRKKRYLNVIWEDYWWEIYDEYGRMVEEHFGNSYTYIHYNDTKHYTTWIHYDQETDAKSKHTWKYSPWEYINPRIDIFDSEKIFDYIKKHPLKIPY